MSLVDISITAVSILMWASHLTYLQVGVGVRITVSKIICVVFIRKHACPG